VNGLHRLQLALQCEGPDSEAAKSLAHALAKPERTALREELEAEGDRLGGALKPLHKGWMGEFALKLPYFRRQDSLVTLGRLDNLQALRILMERGTFEPALASNLARWYGIAELFAREPTSSLRFRQVMTKNVKLVSDGFFLSALKTRRGHDLLKLHERLFERDPGKDPHSRYTLARLQQWTAIWVEGLRNFDRTIDIAEGLTTARYRYANALSDASIVQLTEIAEERFPAEPSRKITGTERFETVSTARMMLNALAKRKGSP
jgi:hypothetical protein